VTGRALRAAVSCWIIALLAWISGSANGQTVTAAVISGRVTREGAPIGGVNVRLLAGTEVVGHGTTNTEGIYTLPVRAAGAGLTLEFRAIGFAPVRLPVTRSADQQRLIRDVELTELPHILEDVVTRGQRPAASPTTSGANRLYGNSQLRRLPVGVGDSIGAIASMVPGGLAPNGQQAGSASYTYDGSSAGLNSLPPEAIGSVSVTPNSFDVTNARSAGTQVAVKTLSGSDSPHGALAYSFRDRALELGAPSTTVDGFSSQNAVDGAYGGPLLQHRLLVFGAIHAERTVSTATSLLSANASSLNQLGLAPDSVANLLSTLRTLGVPTSSNGVAHQIVSEGVNSFGRLDGVISPTETITLTGQYQNSSQQAGSAGALALPTTSTSKDASGASAHLTLASTLGQFENKAQLAVAERDQSVTPVNTLPTGTVTIGSASAGGGTVAVAFGGAGSAAQKNETDQLEADEALTWNSHDNAHHVSLGGYVSENRSDQSYGPNAYGTFSYTSLADLTAGIPASFTRTSSAAIDVTTLTSVLYLADHWQPLRALQLWLGAGAFQVRALTLPALDASVDSAFHLRTNYLPAPIAINPSVGFRWAPVASSPDGDTLGLPIAIVTGGVAAGAASAPGTFAGRVGEPQTQLVCTGSGVPTPAWPTYAGNPGAIPSTCASGGPNSANARPLVTLFDPRDPTPQAWFAAFGVTKPISKRTSVSLNLSGVTGGGVSGASDVNLSPTPQFHLADEGNRAIYVPAGSIDPTTGAVSLLNSRINSQFGQVLALTSRLHQIGGSATAGFQTIGESGALFQLSYTITGSRQQSYFPTPLTMTWAPGPTDGQQQVLAVGSIPIGRAVDIGVLASMTSGSRFTPQVSEDVSGTGAVVSPAFIFDPKTAHDPAVASAMSTLLQSAPGSVRDCLRSQLGALAGLNSCAGPWQPLLNLQLNLHPDWLGLDRRFTLSFIFVNVLSGLDAIVHGSDHLAGWGNPGQPDPMLLYVQGFNPTTNEFSYQVNPRFGSGTASRITSPAPGQLILRGRFVIGPQ
jgi:hypothetical protein